MDRNCHIPWPTGNFGYTYRTKLDRLTDSIFCGLQVDRTRKPVQSCGKPTCRSIFFGYGWTFRPFLRSPSTAVSATTAACWMLMPWATRLRMDRSPMNRRPPVSTREATANWSIALKWWPKVTTSGALMAWVGWWMPCSRMNAPAWSLVLSLWVGRNSHCSTTRNVVMWAILEGNEAPSAWSIRMKVASPSATGPWSKMPQAPTSSGVPKAMSATQQRAPVVGPSGRMSTLWRTWTTRTTRWKWGKDSKQATRELFLPT